MMKPLIEVIKDEESGIRQAVTQVLQKLGLNPLNIPERIQYIFKTGKWTELEATGTLAIEYFIKKLQEEDEETQVEVLEALGRIGDLRAVPTIMETLKAKSSVVRIKAAEILSLFREESAIKPLVQLLGDSECKVRWRAAEILKEFGESAVEALKQGSQDKDNIIRIASTIALFSIGKFSDMETLNNMLQDIDHKKSKSCNVGAGDKWL